MLETPTEVPEATAPAIPRPVGGRGGARALCYAMVLAAEADRRGPSGRGGRAPCC